MKPEHFIYKSDGLYYMQKVPDKCYYYYRDERTQTEEFDYKSYNKALERAKAEAVKVDDPRLIEIIGDHVDPHNKPIYKVGQIYTINMEEKIEVLPVKYPCVENKGCLEKESSGVCASSCKRIGYIARIAAPKKEEESELTQDELNALSSVGIIAKNWYAVSYSKNQMPFAIFESIEYAQAYRDKFSATSIVEPWPMVIKDLRKK